MEKVGVEAVVSGMSSFLGDMGKINSALQGVRGEGTFLQKAFGSVTEGILNFGSSIVRIAETALGVLLRDAIRAVIDGIKELVSATIDAGNEFQTLELRLERLNFNELNESGKAYVDASQAAIDVTKEQLQWLQKLAAQSPYDATDVANTFTLARSYGFTSEEAMKLTESILEFSSGMGLGNQEIERIIINFGQMRAQGKLNGQELRDLARGAFVPVNDILKIMMERMTDAGTITADYSSEINKLQIQLEGYDNDLAVALQRQSEFTDKTKESTKLANQFKIDELRRKIGETSQLLEEFQTKNGKALEVTSENFDSLKKQGLLTGDAVEQFFGAFQQLVDEKFVGSTEKMSTTFKAATGNILDLVKGIFGLNTVKPILDVLGQRAANFANAFTDDPQKWDKLVTAATRLGDALSSVVDGIFHLLPGTGDLADKIIEVVDRAAAWVEENKDNIIGFFQDVADTIREDVVPWIKDNLLPAFMSLIGWISENKGEILDFFKELATTIIEDVVPFVRDHLLPAFKNFADWFVENNDIILNLFDKLGDAVLELAEFFLPKLEKALEWIEENPEKVNNMIDAWAKWQSIGTILNIAGGIIISVAGFILGLIAATSGLIGIVEVLIGVISSPFTLALLAVGATILWLKWLIGQIGQSFDYWKEKFSILAEWAAESVIRVQEAFERGDWAGVGKGIIYGIAGGIWTWGGILIDAAVDAATNAYNAVKSALGMNSPSKLFFDIGANTMEGMALGIQKSAGLAAVTMQGAMARVASAAVPSVTNANVYNSTANYNLTVNSGAQTEPIVQDFNMMSSLAGA